MCADEEAIRRLDSQHSARFLRSWAAHHRLKNYKRLTKEILCVNIGKLINGDVSVLTSEKGPRRKCLSKLRPKRKRTVVPTPSPSILPKTTVPLGYRTCICGTKECKDTMFQYFREVHDYSWPEKYFPWIYVSFPSRPSDCKSRSARARETRSYKLTRHNLFCRHLQIESTSIAKKKDLYVSFIVHFPLIWLVHACTTHSAYYG